MKTRARMKLRTVAVTALFLAFGSIAPLRLVAQDDRTAPPLPVLPSR